MPINKMHSKDAHHSSQEELEVEKLKKLINGHLVKIQTLQEELQDLEKDLSHFFDHYYSSKTDSLEVPHNSQIFTLDQVKNGILSKIAKLCSKDHVHTHTCHETLLKVEGYLNEGTEQTQSPQEQLSNLVVEYYHIIKQIGEEKLKKPAHELKQAIMWVNVKSSETISKIKEEINNRINRPH